MPSEGETKLFVHGVRDTCPRSVLEDEFSKIGPVTDVYITEKGYAFVTMTNSEDADDAARKLNGTTVDGQELKVEIAHGRSRRGSRGGGYRGRFGGNDRGRFEGGGRYHDNNERSERRSYGDRGDRGDRDDRGGRDDRRDCGDRRDRGDRRDHGGERGGY
ncbi:unnamed protein product [Lepeophtheirus salmonis]|uniref:(salmon louse) hypothetical protein n=1 Tax=Lepeophtheirus salmonis TaxID=72036 RepID=A0A0K2U1V1_LEPSM|nr:unnamed protein product [Lepeophtheirus salmonis]CAF2808535.1 unnamed protein product [Lepeophtheirus salmonis]